tara:strand:+ start:146 stop:283 length:138 start_codon:yes stop_codon:yes gene_type:complete
MINILLNQSMPTRVVEMLTGKTGNKTLNQYNLNVLVDARSDRKEF